MPLLALDLGGTKLAVGIFSTDGILISEEKLSLDKRKDKEVGQLITTKTHALLSQNVDEKKLKAIGISVPGIFHTGDGPVWAHNIPGW